MQDDSLLWSILKYIGIGLSSLFGTFCLWFIGRYWGEHAAMYKQFVENNGAAAKALKLKEQQELLEIIEKLKELNHSVNQLKQDKRNLEPVFNQLDDISRALKHGNS